MKPSAGPSEGALLPGPGQEAPDAAGAAPALLQLLWTRGLLRVGLDVPLWDGNLLRFGELQAGNASVTALLSSAS